MQTIGVIGAGQMGSGIAHAVAQSGFSVVLSDIDERTAGRGRDGVAKALDRLVAKAKVTPDDAAAALARIAISGTVAAMSGADVIIEAATEREDVKRRIFESVAAVMGPDTILATNTSSIPITRMASGTPDPARFIGLHFFNPVPVMGLIEVIPGLATSAETLARTRAFAEALGKQVVQSQDEPGFVVNRVLLPMINEAVFWARGPPLLPISTRAAGSASTTRWARWSWPISSGSTPASRSSASSRLRPATASTAPPRCW